MISPPSTCTHKHAQSSISSGKASNAFKNTREYMWFIMWFSSPSRLTYIHVVEEATTALKLLQVWFELQVLVAS
jgi:histone deacetylase complex regulatory component SIN3